MLHGFFLFQDKVGYNLRDLSKHIYLSTTKIIKKSQAGICFRDYYNLAYDDFKDAGDSLPKSVKKHLEWFLMSVSWLEKGN